MMTLNQLLLRIQELAMEDSTIMDRPVLVGGRDPPRYVGEARDAKAKAMDDTCARVLDDALRALDAGRELEAGDLLVEHFDDLFSAGEFEAAKRALDKLDPERLPPKVLTGVLMVSTHARDELGAARVAFFERARKALARTWRLSPEAIEGVARRLQ